MLLKLACLVLLGVVVVVDAQISLFDSTSPSEKSRGATHYRYSINLFSKVNTSLTLSTFGNSGPNSWRLIKFVGEPPSRNKFQLAMGGGIRSVSLPLFNVSNPLIRGNQLIRKEFLCKPSDQLCSRLVIPNMNFKNIGTYSYQSLINGLDVLYVNYNISLFVRPVEFECGSNDLTLSSCIYDVRTQTMTLSIDQEVKINCTVLIAQNSDYEPSIDLAFGSEFCVNQAEQTLIKELVSPTTVNIQTPDNTHIRLYKLTRTCVANFTNTNNLNQNRIECKVFPKFDKSLVPVELVPQIDFYDRVGVYLDLQRGFGVENELNQNRTLIVGINDRLSVNFSCPFNAKPEPVYYWRLSYVSYVNTTNEEQEKQAQQEGSAESAGASASNGTRGYIPRKFLYNFVKRVKLVPDEFTEQDRVYSLPENLEVGTYVVECKAQVPGIVSKFSDTVRFQLSIISKFLIFFFYFCL